MSNIPGGFPEDTSEEEKQQAAKNKEEFAKYLTYLQTLVEDDPQKKASLQAIEAFFHTKICGKILQEIPKKEHPTVIIDLTDDGGIDDNSIGIPQMKEEKEEHPMVVDLTDDGGIDDKIAVSESSQGNPSPSESSQGNPAASESSQGNPAPSYLCVAEKDTVAYSIAMSLSVSGNVQKHNDTFSNNIYKFDATVNGQDVQMIMTSVSGHLLMHDFDASCRNWRSCSPAQLFHAPVSKICPDDSDKIRKTLEREVRYCTALIIWTDCDREGENIGFEIIDVCRAINSHLRVYRAIFSDVTRASVRHALNNLVHPDELQSQAVDVRMELDLRIGSAFTRLQTMKCFPFPSTQILSAGTCRTPILGFICKRQKEVNNFNPHKFWNLVFTHENHRSSSVVHFQWAKNPIYNRDEGELLLANYHNNDPSMATVETMITKRITKCRPQPMDTSELEKRASKYLEISPPETTKITNSLYRKGLISYPRTTSTFFSSAINLDSLIREQTEHPQ